MSQRVKLIALSVVMGILTACGPSKPPVEIDYIVPEDIDVVEMCEWFDTGRRVEDRYCDEGEKGYRWLYDKRAGHPELPAVGERIYRSDADFRKPTSGKIGRIPDRGGWWTEQ